MSDLRSNDLAKIHMAKKDLAMTDDSYRHLLKRLTGYESASELNLHERNKVLAEFKRLGWTPKTVRKQTYSRSSSKMLAAMWSALHKQGKVRANTAAALLAWAAKTTRRDDLKTLDWLTVNQITQCKNGLSKWLKREVKDELS